MVEVGVDGHSALSPTGGELVPSRLDSDARSCTGAHLPDTRAQGLGGGAVALEWSSTCPQINPLHLITLAQAIPTSSIPCSNGTCSKQVALSTNVLGGSSDTDTPAPLHFFLFILEYLSFFLSHFMLFMAFFNEISAVPSRQMRGQPFGCAIFCEAICQGNIKLQPTACHVSVCVQLCPPSESDKVGSGVDPHDLMQRRAATLVQSCSATSGLGTPRT